MTAREYLEQIYLLDQRIQLNLDDIQRLRDLSVKATATITDMPGSATRDTHKMESAIAKMVDLERQIDEEVDKLVDLKATIRTQISMISNSSYQYILVVLRPSQPDLITI